MDKNYAGLKIHPSRMTKDQIN